MLKTLVVKIQHDRPNCIGCAACTAVAPEFWSMNEDGKSDLKGAKPSASASGWTELEIEEKDFELNKSAAEACPVNVIHILKNGDKII